MKADFDIHSGTLLLKPQRHDVWREQAGPISEVMLRLASLISRYEPVLFGAPSVLDNLPPRCHSVFMDYDDVWIRDTGAVAVAEHFVKFGFNAWGGDAGLYADWSRDSTVPEQMSKIIGRPLRTSPLVLEGGNLSANGKGVLLSILPTIAGESRNPGVDLITVENELKRALSLDRVVWLDEGIAYDETGGHVDNLCVFADEKTVMLAWTDDVDNPSYNAVHRAEKRLVEAGFSVVKLPLPTAFARTREDCRGIELCDGSKERTIGELIQPSYVNFIFVNGAVIIPEFDDPMDSVAREIFKGVFTSREIIGFPAREIVLGGGGLHCVTKNY